MALHQRADASIPAMRKSVRHPLQPATTEDTIKTAITLRFASSPTLRTCTAAVEDFGDTISRTDFQWHANYHPDDGQLYFSQQRQPFYVMRKIWLLE